MLSSALRRLTRLDAPAPHIKQLPTTLLVIAATVVCAIVPGVDFTDPPAAFVGLGGILVATVLALVFSVVTAAPRAILIVPMIDLFALGAFRAGTGGTTSLFSVLIILPVLWIAAEPGRRYIVAAAVGTSLAQLTPYAFGIESNDSLDLLRGVFTPLAIAVIAAIVNELSRQGRLQVEALRSLSREREVMLQTSIEQGNQLRENDELLQAAERLSSSMNGTTW